MASENVKTACQTLTGKEDVVTPAAVLDQPLVVVCVRRGRLFLQRAEDYATILTLSGGGSV